MRQRVEDTAYRLQGYFRQYWLVRWTLANMAGWSLGLVIASMLMSMFGLVGLLLGGVVVGTVVGLVQGIAFRTHPLWQPELKRWMAYSAAGGALATIPAYLPGFITFLNFNLGLLLMGLIFGGIIGAVQYRLLSQDFDGALWWVAACLMAGALCAPLSLSASAVWLPVFCSPGPLLFGLITGWMFLKKVMINDEDE